ncbi:MmyB family transcriptional regulator [Streptomyces acidicola]|uniref:MmyB family transcriptional regulator n=1 Tax=Streptomyces acidicola TaxID=2596892 RepID=UPI003817EF32
MNYVSYSPGPDTRASTIASRDCWRRRRRGSGPASPTAALRPVVAADDKVNATADRSGSQAVDGRRSAASRQPSAVSRQPSAVDRHGRTAVVSGGRMDVLAWNRPACALITDFAALPPAERNLWRLVEELSERGEEFRRHWRLHTVRTKSHGLKRIGHPEAGPLTLSYEITHFPQDPELSLLVCTAAPGSPEEKALRVMAESWT